MNFYGCGCCGREIPENRTWCSDCEKHILPARIYQMPWERTYYAQYEVDCPYQVPLVDNTENRRPVRRSTPAGDEP